MNLLIKKLIHLSFPQLKDPAVLVQYAVLWFTAFILPVFFFTKNSAPHYIPKLTLLFFSISIVFFVWIIRGLLLKKLFFRFSLIDLVLLVGLGVTMLTMFFAAGGFWQNVLGPLEQFSLSGLVFLLFALWTVSLLCTTKSVWLWRMFYHAILAGSFLSCLYFLMRGLSFFENMQNTLGLSTVSQSAGLFGIYLTTICLFSFAVLLRKHSGILKGICAFFVSILTLGIMLYLGMSHVWGLCALGCAFLIIIGATHLKHIRKVPFVILGMVFIVSVYMFFLGPATSFTTPEITLSFDISKTIVQKGLAEGPRELLVGGGPGSFVYTFSQFRPAEFNAVIPIIQQSFVSFPHNTMLYILSEMGVLSLVWYVVLILLIVLVVPFALTQKASLLRRLKISIWGANKSGLVLFHKKIYLDVLLLFACWLTLTVGMFVMTYDFMLWWLWWTFLALMVSGIMLIRPELLKEKVLDWHIPLGYHIWAAIGLVLIGSVVIIGNIFFLRVIRAETLAFEARDHVQADDSRVALEKSINFYDGNDVYHRALSESLLAIAKETAKDHGLAQAVPFVISSVNSAKHAVDLEPRNVKNWDMLATVYQEARSIDASAGIWALDTLKETSKREPNNPSYYWRIGEVHAYSGEFAEAKKAYQKAIDVDKSFLQAYITLSEIYELEGDIEKAIQVYDPVLKLSQEQPKILYSLGRLFYNRGKAQDISRAEQLWQKTVNIEPTYADALFGLALVYEEKGDRERALVYYAKVAELNPGNQEIRQKIATLQS